MKATIFSSMSAVDESLSGLDPARIEGLHGGEPVIKSYQVN
jgi:hypothetical protein